MNRLFTVCRTEFKLLTRNFLTIFFALVFPLMMLLLFGSIYGNKPTDFFGGHGGMDASVPGYIALIIAVAGLMTLPLTVAQYRERKILKRFAATPINPTDILVSQIIVNFILTLVGMILLIVVGKLAFDLHFFGNIFLTIFSYILVILCIFSIGLLIAGVAPNTKAATALAYIIYFPMLFLSGATMPLEMMPNSIINISKIIPLTYGVNLLKGAWLGEKLSTLTTDMIVLAVIFIVCTIISIRAFRWE